MIINIITTFTTEAFLERFLKNNWLTIKYYHIFYLILYFDLNQLDIEKSEWMNSPRSVSNLFVKQNYMGLMMAAVEVLKGRDRS